VLLSEFASIIDDRRDTIVSASINRVILLGNLCSDPELRQLPSGSSVCGLRLAVNDRTKGKDGEWTDYANYFDVTVFGSQGERAAEYLSKGRQVAIDGRLRWRQWETQDGQKRSKVEVVADSVQFVGPREGAASPPSAPAEAAGEPAGEDDDGIPW
jgi:single-strand DNA-binding protein